MILKRISRICLSAARAVLYFTLLYFIAAFLGTLIPVNTSFDGGGEQEIWVSSNGVHTDITLHAGDVPFLSQLNLNDLPLPEVRYLSFGWGDLDFYVNTPEWSDLTLSTAAKALFWPTPTAVHVDADYNAPIVSAKTRRINLSREELDRLVLYLQASFRWNGDSIAAINCCSYGSTDRFYHATGSYHIFRTCNVWVNDALKETGVKTSLWAPFDRSVLYYLPEKGISKP